MLYLSRLLVDPREQDVRLDLANCHNLHSRIMTAFPQRADINGNARETFGVLYRIEPAEQEGHLQILVQSNTVPDWDRLPSNYLTESGDLPNPGCKRIDRVYEAITAGTELAFRLRANPTRRIDKSRNPDDPLKGKRVNLWGEEDWLHWIARRGAAGGFDLLTVPATTNEGDIPDVRVQGEPSVRGRKASHHERRKSRPLTFGSVLFEGRLRVSDAALFQTTLRQGIGTAKAYGFGLLSIAPATR